MPDRKAEDPRGDLRWGSIPGLVADAAIRFGDAEAVADGAVRLSFAQLEARRPGCDPRGDRRGHPSR